MNDWFEEKSGHLTDFALEQIIHGEPDELQRLEVAEHLSFCDHCLERYTAAMEEAPLMAPGQLFAPSVLRALRKKVARLTANRYFMAGMSACIALAFWVVGVFDVPGRVAQRKEDQQPRPPFSFSQVMDEAYTGISEFFAKIDLRGVFTSEKE